jgi:hypothetical protein
MGFLNSGGEGAQSFADYFLKSYLGEMGNNRANQELEVMNKLRDAQMREMQAQVEERQRKAQREAGLMKAIQEANVAPLPQQQAQAQAFNTPGSTDTKILPGFNPQGGAIPKPQGFLDQNIVNNILNPQSNVPIMMQPTPQATSTDLNQVGQQQVQGLMQGGFDFNKALPGIMQNLPPEQIPQFLAAMKPPRALGLKVETEEQYNPKTHVTFGRDYVFDQETGKKQYTSEWRPIKGRESTNVNINNGQENKDRTWGSNLRKEFNNLPEVKESNMIMPKINNMEKAFSEAQRTNNFVAVDQALITLYNKLTDPNSVVRESEYARTPENLAIINRLQGKISKIGSGGAGLTMEDRRALLTMARSMKKGYQEIRGKRVNEYRSYAADGGLDAEKTIRDAYPDETPQTPSIPQAAIDYLKQNPKQAIYFEQKYGKGSSKQYLGK